MGPRLIWIEALLNKAWVDVHLETLPGVRPVLMGT